MNKKVLILEDEDNIRSFVVINLKRAGYTTVEFALGEEAVAYVRANNDVDIAILDVMLPDIDGFEVCRRIRGSGSRMGIIMLTALSQENDKLNGFMTGADDYVGKPFSVVELTARVDALSVGPGQLQRRRHYLRPLFAGPPFPGIGEKWEKSGSDPGGISADEKFFGKPRSGSGPG